MQRVDVLAPRQDSKPEDSVGGRRVCVAAAIGTSFNGKTLNYIGLVLTHESSPQIVRWSSLLVLTCYLLRMLVLIPMLLWIWY